MKTASELALEYWNKPPIERVNNTLQDYVYDYMLNHIQEQQKKIDELTVINESLVAYKNELLEELK